MPESKIPVVLPDDCNNKTHLCAKLNKARSQVEPKRGVSAILHAGSPTSKKE